MNDIRVIKKYPNRRLYDTNVSRYITLEEVRQLVLGNVKFRVEDKRTREDITRSILLQVIAEQEEGGNPIFSSELLTHIIRFYGDPMQSSVSRYLELSIQLFLDQHSNFADQLRGLLGQAQQPMQRLKDKCLFALDIERPFVLLSGVTAPAGPSKSVTRSSTKSVIYSQSIDFVMIL
jgi:polyhydroxyalkanoate synthesis repressor PhaR